jgi:hypothetical protein
MKSVYFKSLAGKSSLYQLMGNAIAVSALGASALWQNNANATVWWPEVQAISSRLSVFKDYENSDQFYYIPKSAEVAVNDAGTSMLSHILIFNRLSPSTSASEYHLTLEPRIEGKDIDDAKAALTAQFGSGVALSPLPITKVTFGVTDVRNAAGTSTAPFSVAVPEWTGDLHSFDQRFSVVMRGAAYQSEPAMSRFMTNPAGNAFVGTMHYGFRGVHVPFKASMVVNIHQFASKLRAHLSFSTGWYGADIGTAIDKIKDDQGVFENVVKDKDYESAAWNELKERLIQRAFIPLPVAPDAPTGGGGGMFSFSAQYSQISVDAKDTIDVTEAVVEDHSGDIDVTGGNFPAAQLDPNIKYFCDMWAKYSLQTNKCENICEPVMEYYNPATKACAPAFGQ